MHQLCVTVANMALTLVMNVKTGKLLTMSVNMVLMIGVDVNIT